MERQVRYHFVKYSRERRGTMENFLRNSIPYLNYTKSVFRSRDSPKISPISPIWKADTSHGRVPLQRRGHVAVHFLHGPFLRPASDWWMDERRDPYRSTEAAASYLARLYDISTTGISPWLPTTAAKAR